MAATVKLPKRGKTLFLWKEIPAVCNILSEDDMGDIRVFMNSLPEGLNFRHNVCMHYIVSHLAV